MTRNSKAFTLDNSEFIEILKSNSETHIIREILKENIYVSDNAKDCVFYELSFADQSFFAVSFLGYLSKLNQSEFDEISEIAGTMAGTRIWGNSQDQYIEHVSNLTLIRSYLDGTPAQVIADSISDHICQD